MHIPDGFLSTSVWAALDVAAVPAVAALARRAQRDFEDRKVPLLGVMGAFVFAAQMINFPVGAGTSGHLVGSTLLAVTLGPAAASVVMVAILTIQALVFQDGGVLALGANVFNMAIAGVLAGWLPYQIWGAGSKRKFAIFLGGMMSVLAAALLAVAELLVSGILMPGAVLGLSLALFLVSAILEGAITVGVIGALETLQPAALRGPQPASPRMLTAVSLAAVGLAAAGVVFASASPDGLEKLIASLGLESRARMMMSTPLADYEASFLGGAWLRKSGAGLIGLALIWGACLGCGRWLARRRSA